MEYGWNQEKDAEVVFSQHLAGNNPQQITEEFKLIQEENTRCQKNTLSFMLSPTSQDGKNLTKEQLKELTQRFIKEMQLKERQAIAFVHRDKAHTHVHLYVNRIGFDGKAYNDSFIGKRSQLGRRKRGQGNGADHGQGSAIGKGDWIPFIPVLEIKNIHQRVMEEQKPRTLDDYMKAMKAKEMWKSSRPSTRRTDYRGSALNTKAIILRRARCTAPCREAHIIGQLSQNKGMGKQTYTGKSVQVLGKTIGNEYQPCY